MPAADATMRPIVTRSVVDQVTKEIRRLILGGTLRPGQEFALRSLASSLKVSLIPVREALRSLESEGLVVTRPNRSAIVSLIYLDDLRSIYRIRRSLEPEIASRSCMLLSAAALDRLENEARGFSHEGHGIDEIYESHHAFHVALLSPAASQWDIRILTNLWNASERYIRIGFGRLDPDPREHHRRGHAHQALVDAFRERHPFSAADAVRAHLDHNEQLAMEALRVTTGLSVHDDYERES